LLALSTTIDTSSLSIKYRPDVLKVVDRYRHGEKSFSPLLADVEGQGKSQNMSYRQ
jgi:hypothetical protein